MRTIFEQVIARGDYDLTAMLQNIDRYHIEGKLTDEDREALYALAREGAQPVYDYAAEIEAIWAAIHALQGADARPGGMARVCAAHRGARRLRRRGTGHLQRPAVPVQIGKLRMVAGRIPGRVGTGGII